LNFAGVVAVDKQGLLAGQPGCNIDQKQGFEPPQPSGLQSPYQRPIVGVDSEAAEAVQDA